MFYSIHDLSYSRFFFVTLHFTKRGSWTRNGSLWETTKAAQEFVVYALNTEPRVGGRWMIARFEAYRSKRQQSKIDPFINRGAAPDHVYGLEMTPNGGKDYYSHPELYDHIGRAQERLKTDTRFPGGYDWSVVTYDVDKQGGDVVGVWGDKGREYHIEGAVRAFHNLIGVPSRL